MGLGRERSWLIGIGLWGMSALAGPDPGSPLLERLYTKFATAYSSGQPWAPGSEMVLLSSPGLTFTPDQVQDRTEISALFDQIPIVSRWYHPSGVRVSDLYGAILRQSRTSAFVNMTKRDAYNAAMESLFDRTRPGMPTPKLAAYRKLQAAYLNWQSTYVSARDAERIAETEKMTSDVPVSPQLPQAVADALKHMADLKVKMAEVERALAIIDAFNRARAGAWFLDLRQKFEASQAEGAEGTGWFPALVVEPPIEKWLDPTGWKLFSFKQRERPLPPIALPSGTPQDPAKAASAMGADWVASLSLSLETKRVHISRPWLAPSLFTSRAWRLGPECEFHSISTGKPGDPDPGVMPLMVTGLLLGRNLVLKGKWAQDRAILTRAGVSFTALGPFNLGKAAKEKRRQVAEPIQAEEDVSITCEDAQIIGFFCQVLPKTPDPDSTFQ